MGATPAHCIYGRHRATPAFYVNRNMRQNGRIWVVWGKKAPNMAMKARGRKPSMAGMAMAIPGVLGVSKTGDTMQWAKFGDIWTRMAKTQVLILPCHPCGYGVVRQCPNEHPH